MNNKSNETNITKVFKMMETIFCPTIVKRIICIILIAFEVDKNIISKKFNISLKSIKKYNDMFNFNQINELLSIKSNSRKSELEDYKDMILAELEKCTYKNLRQITAMIEKLTGLKRSRQRISMFLKKWVSTYKSRTHSSKSRYLQAI